jgi:hypothetical protein
MDERKIDTIISLQQQTLQEFKSMELKIDLIQRRLESNEKEAYEIKVETAKNTNSIKYQWWIITFI